MVYVTTMELLNVAEKPQVKSQLKKHDTGTTSLFCTFTVTQSIHYIQRDEMRP